MTTTDKVMVVDGDLAWSRMKKIIAEFDYGIGPTCGANVALCEEVALQYSGKNFVTLFLTVHGNIRAAGVVFILDIRLETK